MRLRNLIEIEFKLRDYCALIESSYIIANVDTSLSVVYLTIVSQQ